MPELVGQCDPGTTIEVVKELAIRGPHRFFTGLTQIVSGRPKWQMSQDEIEALWASVAFYNFVPRFVATGPRVRPTPAMWEAGAEPFAAVHADLQPDAMIVCGNDLWWWLHRGRPDLDERQAWKVRQCCIGSTFAAHIMHPSANSFSSTKVRPIVEALMSAARTA